MRGISFSVLPIPDHAFLEQPVLERQLGDNTLTEIVTLSLIYGRSFESLFAMIMSDARRNLKVRAKTLPKEVRSYVGTFNRESSINRLKDRLATDENGHGGA